MKMEIVTFRHGEAELWCRLGEFFASPEVRRALGLPLASEKGYIWWVALIGDEVAGFAAIRVRTSVVEFRHAYVLPQYRDQGIFGRLFEERLAYGLTTGKRLVATVNDHSLPAFLASGFERVGARGQYTRVARSASIGSSQ